jgi:Ulp1 family protease
LNKADLAGLEPGKWLTGAVLNAYFEYMCSKCAEHYHHTVFNKPAESDLWHFIVDGPVEYAARYFQKIQLVWQPLASPGDEGYLPSILMPILYKKHWTLLHIDLRNGILEHYDSWDGPSNRYSHEICQIMINFLNRHYIKQSWEWERVKGLPKQQNSHDCGVFVCQFLDLALEMLTKKDLFYWMEDRWSVMNRDSIASQIKMWHENSIIKWNLNFVNMVFPGDQEYGYAGYDPTTGAWK